MKILFQIRPNAFTQPGGDTVTLNKITSGLQELGVNVEVDTSGNANLTNYDCLFLFNFSLPQLLKQQAEKAVQAGVPYVILSLNEDLPKFYTQSHLAAAVLAEYVKVGQPKEKFADIYPNPWETTPAPRFDNEWAASNAALIFTTGQRESKVIKQYYPHLNNLCSIYLGIEEKQKGSAPAFEAEFGVKDFVLSVGRIESRKNQLMLLKALEDSELTLVLASGGFTYQPDYDQAVRNFKRIGKTVILNKLTDEQLSNAYAAAKVHALPSWYELPGLVSIEAASFGKNVVVSDMGSTRDYFGDLAFYCDPANPDSVKNAVLAAYYSEAKSSLKARVSNYSWANTCQQIVVALEKALGKAVLSFEGSTNDLDISAAPTVSEIIEKAEKLARSGEVQQALDMISTFKRDNRSSSALWRAEGMLLIALKGYQEAENCLKTAYSLDPKDSRVVCGLGICAKQNGDSQNAYELFVQALNLDKDNKIAILQLLGLSYELNRFSTLERVLKDYVTSNPEDNDMSYALAGCLYRQNDFQQAKDLSEQIIKRDPQHNGASELLELLTKQAAPLPENKQSFTINSNPSNVLNNKVEPLNNAVMLAIGKIVDLKRNQKFAQGLEECTKLLGDLNAQSPELEEVYSLHGELMALNGQISEAERRFNGILVQFPNSVRALCGLGALCGEKRNWVEAEEYFRKAVAINPACDVAYAGLALSSLTAGDKEAAWHYYDKALLVNPENLRALFGIMELGYPDARYNDIERVLKNYLELHPANLDFLYSLAGCLFAQSKFDEANQEIEKILMFSPEHSKAIELKEAIKNRVTSK